MKTLKKIIIICSFALALSTGLITGTIDAHAEETSISTQDNDPKSSNMLRADVIEKKFRVYYGKVQYRHWNRTRGKWVEDHWIDLT